jgi:crotonobetainyl-CoA:carnitine CoA-transferase CaiB-like acyl-CoA transferase
MDALAAFFVTRTKDDLFREAVKRGLLIAPVATTADVFESGQLRERDYWTPIEHPSEVGTVTYPGPFAKFSEAPITYRRPPPDLGEHNEEVYQELLDLDAEAVIALRAANAI